MSIASDLIRGHTDTIILSQLMAGDSYGYQINKNIQEKTNQEYELKEATLYSAFRRLEQAGYICSYWGNETTGARRRYYTITKEGREACQERRQEWERSKVLIDQLIYEENRKRKGNMKWKINYAHIWITFSGRCLLRKNPWN